MKKIILLILISISCIEKDENFTSLQIVFDKTEIPTSNKKAFLVENDDLISIVKTLDSTYTTCGKPSLNKLSELKKNLAYFLLNVKSTDENSVNDGQWIEISGVKDGKKYLISFNGLNEKEFQKLKEIESILDETGYHSCKQKVDFKSKLFSEESIPPPPPMPNRN
jgi:hypothetical protein